jgi:hypothetical protein
VDVADLDGETNSLPITVLLPQVEGIKVEKFAPAKVQVELVKIDPKL